MTDCSKVTTYSSWLAIDIAKDFNVVMLETIDGNKKRFRMVNSAKDHDRLIELITNSLSPVELVLRQLGTITELLPIVWLPKVFRLTLFRLLLAPGTAKSFTTPGTRMTPSDPDPKNLTI